MQGKKKLRSINLAKIFLCAMLIKCIMHACMFAIMPKRYIHMLMIKREELFDMLMNFKKKKKDKF